MQEKKVFTKFLICIGISFMTGLLLISGFVYLVDPFYHYHEPWFDMPIILENAVYQTAGVAKNLDYDSAIVGTSMTENMHTSWFDEEMNWKTMKISYAGARSKDLQAIFEEISQNEGEIHNIVMDINDYQLTSDSETSYAERPEYLYDEKWYNDYKYLLNRDVVNLSFSRVMDGLQDVEDNIDVAYIWGEEKLFGKEIAKNTFSQARGDLVWERYQEFGEEGLYHTTGETTDDFEQRIEMCRKNLDNITPFIEENPDIRFYIFIPPYSMIYWERKVLLGELETALGIYEYTIGELLKYDNVKVYYFQNEPEIISDLDNYLDSCHHRPEYNKYIFECIRDDKNLLTTENYRDEIVKMYQYAKDFPYATLWAEEEVK